MNDIVVKNENTSPVANEDKRTGVCAIKIE